MENHEFEQFVRKNGKDILRFCRMTTQDEESGNELYQDTMLKLTEKLDKLDATQNMKSYAISVSIMLWKYRKKKYSVRRRIVAMGSLEESMEKEGQLVAVENQCSAEDEAFVKIRCEEVRSLVAELPEKYKMPLYLQFSADMKLEEIAKCLHLPIGTVKTRIWKAKQILKNKLEAIGYDG